MKRNLFTNLSWAALLLSAGAGSLFSQTITALNPNVVAAGGADFLLTITGTTLDDISQIVWTDQEAGSPFVINVGEPSPTGFSVLIPAARIAAAGTASIVACSTPSQCSNALPLTIRPTPTLTSLSPASIPAGSPAFSLTLTGTGFTSQDQVSFNGTLISAVAGGGGTTLTATIPASLITNPGNYPVFSQDTVDGATSNSKQFTVGIQLNTLGPNSTLAGGPSLTVNIDALGGLGFNTQILWNGTTVLQQNGSPSSGNISVTVPAALIATPAINQITAVTNGITSNALAFTAIGPVTTGLNPNSATAGSGPLTVTITGTGFGLPTTGGPIAIWTAGGNGTILAQTQASTPTTMIVTVPANLLTTPGTATITVQNYPSGGPISNGQTFRIYAVPVITSVTPTTIPFGASATPITANGTFNGGTPGDTLSFAGTPLTTTATATQLQATVPANLLTSIGQKSITAANPLGAQSSSNTTIGVIPVISSLNPANVTAGSPQFTLTVTATGGLLPATFSATVNFNGTNLAGTINGNQVTATVPANLVVTPGTVPVTLTQNNVTSAPANFTIGSLPTITNVTPNSTTVGTAQTLAVTGTNFVSNSIVVYTMNSTSTNLQTALTNAGLTAVLPANLVGTAGPATITVLNGLGTTPSNGVPFTVLPGLALTSVTPNTATAGDTSVFITLTGTGFKQDTPTSFGARVLISPPGTNKTYTLTPITNTGTVLTAAIQQVELPFPGVATIAVSNAGDGQTSNSLPFTIVARPVITSLSPNPAPVASNSTLIVTGLNFSNTDVVQIAPTGPCNSESCLQTLVTTYISGTSLSAALPGNLVPTQGTYNVYVQNSLGSTTSPAILTVSQVITSLTPATVSQNKTAQLVVQAPGGFDQTSVILYNNQPLTTVYDSPTQVHANLSAANVASAGTYQVTVQNGTQTASNALPFTVVPLGQLTSISPTSVFAGSPQITVQVTGSNFNAGDTVNFNALSAATTFVNSQLLTAVIPAAWLANATTYVVGVVNNHNDSTNTMNFQVLLHITGLTPPTVQAGSAAFNLTATLTGGVTESSRLYYAGTSLQQVSATSTTITVQVPAGLIATPATNPVYVTDGQSQSNTVNHFVLGPISLISASPAFASAGAASQQITLTGTGFDSGTVAFFNGTQLATTVSSGTQLIATIPGSLLGSPATAQITAMDSHENTSNALQFSVLTPLTLTSLSPSSALAGAAQFTLTVNGSGFDQQSTVLWNTSPLTTTFVTATQLTAIVPANLVAQVGTASVSVLDSRQRASNALTFTIGAPFGITSLNPNSITAGNGVNMTITGQGFLPPSTRISNTTISAQVLFGGVPLPATVVSDTQITTFIPGQQTRTPGTVSVAVQLGTATSNSLPFTITGSVVTTPPSPTTLISLSPSFVAPGVSAFVLTATGTGFQPGAIVSFNGLSLFTNFLNSTQLAANVPASAVSIPGNIVVYVTNPDGGITNSLNFIVSSKPTITSLNPALISAGAPSFTLTVNGTLFQNGAVVAFGGTHLSTTFGNSTQLTATVPASLVQTAGSLQVIVTNPDGTATLPATFTVTQFSLSSINPATATAGSPAVTLTLNGAGFVTGATASFNGTSLTTTFVNASTLTATIPASLLTTPGSVPVTVRNPDGAVAGPVTFAVRGTITLSSINPSSIPANSKATVLTLTGAGFVSGATARFNGSPIATTFVSATSLTATIPAAQLTTQGSFPVSVVNPNGDSSNVLTLAVGAALAPPSITSISPSTLFAGASATTMTVNGAGFVQGSVVQFGGANAATTFVSATQLTVALTVSQLSQAGTFTVQVVNPNGDQSNTVTFTLVTRLSITSVSPAALAVGAGDSQITIAGAGILTGATVQFGTTSLPGTVTSSTQVTATVPAAALTTAGTINVTVTNPDGTVSNALPITLVGLPAISLTATVTPAGTNQVTITLTSPAPTDLLGTLVLTFVANPAVVPAGYVDPAMQFAAGGTSISFTIPKGSTTATLPGNGVFSPGTVAGTITLTLTRLVAGIDNVLPNPRPSQSFVISPAAPSITASTVKIINGTSTGFTVEMLGFSTTRELKTATLTFTSSQTITGGSTFTVDVTSAFNAYFASTNGIANGGTFKLDIPFTITGADASIVTGVTVTLTNSAGVSTSVSGGR